MKKIIFALYLFLSALLGAGATEVTDEKVNIPIIEQPAIVSEQDASACTSKIIAYTDTEKYYCDCIGVGCPCRTTEEILSELG